MDLQWTELSAVPHQLYPVVDGDVLIKAAAIEDSTLVSSPGGGVSCDSERSNLSNVVHDGVLVIGVERVVSTQSYHWSHLVQVIVALPTVSSAAGHVGPVRVSNCSEQLEVVEAELRERVRVETKSF